MQWYKKYTFYECLSVITEHCKAEKIQYNIPRNMYMIQALLYSGDPL